jgi:hypothetical protein
MPAVKEKLENKRAPPNEKEERKAGLISTYKSGLETTYRKIL